MDLAVCVTASGTSQADGWQSHGNKPVMPLQREVRELCGVHVLRGADLSGDSAVTLRLLWVCPVCCPPAADIREGNPSWTSCFRLEIRSLDVTLIMVFPLPQEEIWFISPISGVLTCPLQSICLTEVISSSWWTKNLSSTRFHHSCKTSLKFITAEAVTCRCVKPHGSKRECYTAPRAPCCTWRSGFILCTVLTAVLWLCCSRCLHQLYLQWWQDVTRLC